MKCLLLFCCLLFHRAPIKPVLMHMLNVLLSPLPISHVATHCKDETIYTHAQTYTHTQIICIATSLTCGNRVVCQCLMINRASSHHCLKFNKIHSD